MRYLRTTLATDWPEQGEGSTERLRATFIPDANPSYRNKWHLVRWWYIEFNDDDLPWREIGLDSDGAPVLAGPSRQDYGFWLDTNMCFNDFEGELIEQGEFEAKWQQSGVIAPE